MSQPDGENTSQIEQSEQDKSLDQTKRGTEKRFLGLSGTVLRSMHQLRGQLRRGARTAQPGLVDEDVKAFEEKAALLTRLTAAARKEIHASEEAVTTELSEDDMEGESNGRIRILLEQARHESEGTEARTRTLIATAFGSVDVEAFIDELNSPEAFALQVAALREAEEKGEEQGGITDLDLIAAKRALCVVGETLIGSAQEEGYRERDDNEEIYGYETSDGLNHHSRFRTKAENSDFIKSITNGYLPFRREINEAVHAQVREEASALQAHYEEVLPDMYADDALVLSLREAFIQHNFEPQLAEGVRTEMISGQKRDAILAVVQRISDENIINPQERYELFSSVIGFSGVRDYAQSFLQSTLKIQLR